MADIFDDMAKAFKAGYDAGRAEAADEIEQLVGALKQIAKLKSSPDDNVNEHILIMAKVMARVAVGEEE